MELYAKWLIAGVISERRTLTSKKNETWKGYVFKLATLGATYEIQCTAEQFDDIADGQYVICEGRFEEQSGHQRFVLGKVMDPPADRAGKAVA